MAATATVAQNPSTCQSPQNISPRSGVITLSGYGIKVQVERGHLTIEDGVGSDRTRFRLPRVGHGLERLIVIGNDGVVSLAALRWLSDQNAAFLMLERNGKIVSVTGPVRPSDARLRRAQALAHQSDRAFCIARELIDRKLAGQEKVARETLGKPDVAQEIVRWRSGLAEASSSDDVRRIESQAAAEYWSAWRKLPITFPKLDLVRTPEHWRRFDTRKSVLSGSQRLATNPVNAMLNYLYAILESESRLAVSTMGLDPGLGFIHMDAPARDSLACDLMEAVRSQVDRYVLDWFLHHPLKREWFFEQRDGTCRLMASLAVQLSDTARIWRHAVAPIAEWITRTLWKRSSPQSTPATPLTQTRKRASKGIKTVVRAPRIPKREALCQKCGKRITDGHAHCSVCAVDAAKVRFAEAARKGRIAAGTLEARVKSANKQRINTKACWDWDPSTQPSWLTPEFYTKNIQPRLASMSLRTIARGIGISLSYAGELRKGRVAHPRHWQKLADMTGIDG